MTKTTTKGVLAKQTDASVRWTEALADYLKFGGTPVDAESDEFIEFAVRNLTNIVRVWRTKKTGIMPVTRIENLGKVTADNRWFYTPPCLYHVANNSYVGATHVITHGPVRQIWWWDERLFTPARVEVNDLTQMPTLKIIEQRRHQSDYIAKARPRSLKARKPRHKKLGLSSDMSVIRCEPGMFAYVDCDAFLRALSVMSDEVTVFHGWVRPFPERPEEPVFGIRDALRTWMTVSLVF